jgi:hypothetical protein
VLPLLVVVVVRQATTGIAPVLQVRLTHLTPALTTAVGLGGVESSGHQPILEATTTTFITLLHLSVRADFRMVLHCVAGFVHRQVVAAVTMVAPLE